MSARSVRARLAALATTTLVLGGVGPAYVAHAAAAAAPDLKVVKAELVQHQVGKGGTIKVVETTRNVGSKRSGPSRTAYWLSKDSSKSSRDRQLGQRRVGALGPAHSDAASLHLTVPASTAPGSWYVIACADAGNAVREQNEKNNCRAMGSRLKVLAGPSGSSVTFPQTPHPMKVEPTFGTPAAPVSVSAVAASTSTVTGPDGTSYALTIPANAVNQTISMTMTPLASVSGAPMSSGLIGGVRLQPTGLLLNRDATLTITPPHTPSRTTATGFRFYDGGVELGMYPLNAAGSTASSITLDVTEFATFAVGNSSDADRASALSHPPTLVNGQFDNAVAPLVRAQQLGRTPVPRSATPAPLDADSENYYQQVVAPHLASALAGDPNAATYVHDALAYIHRQAVLGIDDPHEADVMSSILELLSKEVSEAYTRCKNNHSMPDLGRLLADSRVYAVLGAPADADNAYEKYRACGHFDVVFTALTTQSVHYVTEFGDTHDLDASWQLSTPQPLHLTADANGRFTGFGPLAHDSQSYTDKDTSACSAHERETIQTTITGTADGVEAANLVVDLQPSYFYVGPGIPQLPVAQDPQVLVGASSPPKETYTLTQSGCSPGSSSSSSPQWYFIHGQAHVPFPIVGDTGQSGGLLIDKTFTFDNGGPGDITGEHVTDTTTVSVTHVPQ